MKGYDEDSISQSSPIISGLPSQDNTGHFGPFQTCKYAAYYSFCGTDTYFQPSDWLIAAGVCAVFSVLALAAFCFFAIIHVVMQLQVRVVPE